MKKLMMYGATGYHDSTIVRHALEANLQVIIAGRDRQKLAAMASEPERAKKLGDFVVTTLRGFSTAAVTGLSRPRLLKVARMDGQAVAALLSLNSDT